MPTLDDEAIARKMWADAKDLAVGVAGVRGHGLDQVEYSPEDERTMFMTEAPGWTIEKELALLAEGKSRAEVGALKYSQRQKMAQSGPRFLDKYEQAKWLAGMRQQLDPTWMPMPPQGSQPPTVSSQPMDSGPMGEEL